MNKHENETVLPTYFISHGGGPWYWMNEQKPLYEKLEKSLQVLSNWQLFRRTARRGVFQRRRRCAVVRWTDD